jgi:hypothetical protein
MERSRAICSHVWSRLPTFPFSSAPGLPRQDGPGSGSVLPQGMKLYAYFRRVRGSEHGHEANVRLGKKGSGQIPPEASWDWVISWRRKPSETGRT